MTFNSKKRELETCLSEIVDLKKDYTRRQVMTGLNRTDLPATLKIELASSSLSMQGIYGAVTKLAREYGVSRSTVYTAGETAHDILEEYFVGEESEAKTIVVDERQLERAIFALRVVAPNSIRAIETLLPILYPDHHLSYGKIHQKLVLMEERAAEFNAQEDLSEIEVGALDEMFSQGNPVLAGVDLDSGYLFSLGLREQRSGEDWAEVLRKAQQQGLDLQKVVKDAAQGIAAGTSEVFPDAEQRDDCFHALYKMGQLNQYLERRAYGSITKVDEAKRKLEKAQKKGRDDLSKLLEEVVKAEQSCTKVIELHDAFESAMREAVDAMEFVDLDTGRIRTAEEMEMLLKGAAEKMIALPHKHCVKVGKYIGNRASGLSLYMNELNDELADSAAVYGDIPVRLACIIYRLSQDLESRKRPWAVYRDKQHLLGAFAMLSEIAGDRAFEILDTIDFIMQRRHRASSAIEGFNAALRPFLYVHKGVTDGFLELFRAYYNLRTRRWGKHKGTSAHETLTGEEVSDWLSLLGYPPSSN
jgi:hypothetical protein